MRGYLRYDRDDPTVPPDRATRPTSRGARRPAPCRRPATTSTSKSSPGDYIGQGRTSLYTPDNSTISATESSGVIDLHVDEGQGPWDVNVSGPDAQTQLLAGLYEDLGRYPFHNPTEGGLSMFGEGRGCNTLAGAFAVDSSRTTRPGWCRSRSGSSSAQVTGPGATVGAGGGSSHQRPRCNSYVRYDTSTTTDGTAASGNRCRIHVRTGTSASPRRSATVVEPRTSAAVTSRIGQFRSLNTMSASGLSSEALNSFDVLGARAREVVEPVGGVRRDRRERGDGPDPVGQERRAGERVRSAA